MANYRSEITCAQQMANLSILPRPIAQGHRRQRLSSKCMTRIPLYPSVCKGRLQATSECFGMLPHIALRRMVPTIMQVASSVGASALGRRSKQSLRHPLPSLLYTCWHLNLIVLISCHPRPESGQSVPALQCGRGPRAYGPDMSRSRIVLSTSRSRPEDLHCGISDF